MSVSGVTGWSGLVSAATSTSASSLARTFCVAYSSIFDYYRTPSVLFSHTNNFLYIQLKVPLVHKAGLTHIYRTQSFPIPVENTDPDTYTQIEGIPPYFAVSPDGTHHAILPYPKFNIINVTLNAVKCVSS